MPLMKVSIGNKWGVLFLRDAVSTSSAGYAAATNIYNTLANTTGSRQKATLEALLPGFDINVGGAVPGHEDRLFYFPPIPESVSLGVIYALASMSAFIRQPNTTPTGVSISAAVERVVGTIRGSGLEHAMPTGTLLFLQSILVRPDMSRSSRNMSSQDERHVGMDHSNVANFLKAIETNSTCSIGGRSVTRKILRRASLLVKSWACEMMFSLNNNIRWDQFSLGGDNQMRVAADSVRAILEYFELRGSQLNRPGSQWLVLNTADVITESKKTYGVRITDVFKKMFGKRAIAGISYEQCVDGGPAVMFCGYAINVKMAYAIISYINTKQAELTRNGDNYNHLGGHLWNNPTSVLPVLSEEGNNKHFKTVEMVKACISLIEQYPPVQEVGSDGEKITGSWVVNLDNVEHADISINKVKADSLRSCTHCGVLTDTADALCDGSDHNGYPVFFEDKKKCVCKSCMINGTGLFMIDKRSWFVRSLEGTRYAELPRIDLHVFKLNGERTGNTRSAFISKEMGELMKPYRKGCPTCGGGVYDREKMAESSDSFIRAFSTDVRYDTELADMVCLSTGRDISSSRASTGFLLRVNHSATVHDSGSEHKVCNRCANLAALYKDPTDGRYYSNIDNSPSAPEYGYKVTDPSGRFLDRVIGIEFETGPGSMKSRDLDEYLNGRCSDGIHVWNIHGDGSLMNGACEITTPPIGGLAIPMAVDAMFALAKRDGFYIENRQAGMHIHTNVTDLWEVMLPIRKLGHDGKAKPKALYASFCQLLGRFGDALSEVSRQFVSIYRRNNQYCAGGFGVRSWALGSDDAMANYRSPIGGGRQAVCVHQHNGYSKRTKVTYTLENRIWPSSNSKEYTLARAELTQKAVDMFCVKGIAYLQSDGEDTSLLAFVDAFERLTTLTTPAGTAAFVLRLASMFTFSGETIEALTKLHRRFFWITYYAHEHGLAMNSAEIVKLRAESLSRAGLSVQHFNSTPHANEVAGILESKGLAPRKRTDTALGDISNSTVMDTMITSHAYNPITTDESDLFSGETFTSTHH